MTALTGELSLDSEGTVLTATTDLQLAWKWAEHVIGERWAQLSCGQCCVHVADALSALRAAVDEDAPVDPLSRACEGCGVEPDEPCWVGCLSHEREGRCVS